MKTIIVASTEPYAGKSGISLALLNDFSQRGLACGYFKPFGTMPVTVDGVLTDQDAAYISTHACTQVPLETVCPVVRTRGLIEELVRGAESDRSDTVRAAYAVASAGAEIMVVEGTSDLSQARCVGLSICELAEILDARVLLVDKPDGVSLPDRILYAADCLGDRLLGVVFNAVHESFFGFVRDAIWPFLEARGVRVFGVMPHDAMLSSVTVQEIVDALDGAVLCADERLDEAVESFMVGAMGQEKALRFFRRKARKAVITGGDRSDVQLAALETDTRCIVLTGNLPPSSLVLSRAEDLGVPMILVGMDTLSAVEAMERLLGRVRLHDPSKADRIREMFTAAVDADALLDELNG
ncbi:MAG: phosphotransacetylase family protein [Actinomycetota bacterium]|nr:phosphotransacetylase family protein [Actinomycetota bacterium]